MKKKSHVPFDEYIAQIPAAEADNVRTFFAAFDAHCLLDNTEKAIMREDLEKAILHYARIGVTTQNALERLDVRHLGGFYARPPALWFPLDDAAKIYPLSMEHGRMSVFRLSVYLKENVIPELLQMALTFTIKRFPSFATTLKKGFFWHYLDTTKRRFSIQQENDIPCQPLKVSQSGSQSFRVLYWENRISVEFFHVLTDGTGGMLFLKALTTEYLRLAGEEITPVDDAYNVDIPPATEEFRNTFADVPRGTTAAGFVDKAALQMTGRLSKNRPCRVIHLKMEADALKAVAERYQTTVTVYLLALMFLAGKASTDELQGEASIQVPVNMRKFYPSRTVRNFSMYCGIRLPVEAIGDLPEMIREIGAQLHKKASKESMSEMLTATEKLVNMLKYIPLAIKQPVAKLVYGFLGDKIFTNTLSNLGVVSLPPSAAVHIDSMDFVLGTAITNRAGCGLVTFGTTTTLSITKLTADPTFEETMYDLLSADGLAVVAEGSELYGH